MDSCAVSVLVPAYNVEKYLRQCLDSLVNQTLKNIQIICINDGSSDSTLSILEEYACNDDRIEIISKKNTGYGHSMNLGLERARGEYIGIVEPDDFADIHMFEKLYRAAIDANADVVKSNYYAHESENNPEQDKLVENLVRCGYGKVFAPRNHRQVLLMQPAIWSAIYRRSFLEENGISFLETPGASFQDTGFNFKVLATTERALLLKEGYLHYRVDNASSSVKSMSKVFCICDEYDEIWRFAESRDRIFEELRHFIPYIQFGGYIWNLDRLSPELQHGFYDRFIADFAKLNEAGHIEYGSFGEPARTKLASMLDDPEGYYYKNYGPSSVENTYVIWSDKSKNARELLDNVLRIAGRNDEVISASRVVDRCITQQDNADPRAYLSSDLFDNACIGSLLRNRVRGKRLITVCGDGSAGSLDSCFNQIEEALRDGDTSASISVEGVMVSSFDTEELFSLDTPVILQLLSNGYYLKSVCGATRADKMPNLEAGLDCSLITCNEYVEAADKLGQADKWGCAEATTDEAKLIRRELLAPLWKDLRNLYEKLPESIRRAVKKPSSLDLPSIELAAGPNEAVDVSVIMPVYNVARFLPECLDSVLGQRDVSLQVICIDDGSSDGSRDILLHYAEKDSRICVLSQLNGGAGAARNRGIERARGGYLAFIDPDDFYPSNQTLSHMLIAARDNSACMAGGSFSTIDPSGFVCEDLHEEEPFYCFHREGWRDASKVPTDYGWIRFIYSRTLFEGGLRFPELAWYEDPVFFLRALAKCGKLYAIPEVTYRYRVDYKPENWNEIKSRDLLKGISENIEAAISLGNKSLYSLMVRRIDWDYCDRIVRTLDDEGVLVELLKIQANLDDSMLDSSRPLGEYHLLAPLAVLQGNGNAGRGTAVVRLARRLEASTFYRGMQAAVRRIRRA